MKRILFFNDSMEVAGTERLLLDLLNHLSQRNTSITLLLPSFDEKHILLQELDSRVEVRYLYSARMPYSKRKLLENIQIFCPRVFMKIVGLDLSAFDRVVCFKESFYAKALSKAKCLKVLWVHNILYKRTYQSRTLKEQLSEWLNKKHIRISQKSYDNFDTIVCVSDACKSSLLDIVHNGVHPKQDIRIIYNAIDLGKLKEKAIEYAVNMPQDRINFVLVTRVSPEKRIDRLIDSIITLRNEGYNFHVYIIGERVEEYAQETYPDIDLGNHITYTGYLSNPHPYIQRANWSLCVSERESFSLALLESMALATPVITTNCGGPANIIENGKYGILVDNDGNGVYAGMKKVLTDQDLSIKHSKLLDKAVERFEYQGWLESINELLGTTDSVSI